MGLKNGTLPPSELFFEGGKHCGNRLVEVVESEWMEQLKKVLQINDERADFTNKARHFMIPLYDDFLEVVSWNVTYSYENVAPLQTRQPEIGDELLDHS